MDNTVHPWNILRPLVKKSAHWISVNKHWVFEGIGVAVLGAILAILWPWIWPSPPETALKHAPSPSSEASPQVGNESVSEGLVRQLIQEIRQFRENFAQRLKNTRDNTQVSVGGNMSGGGDMIVAHESIIQQQIIPRPLKTILSQKLIAAPVQETITRS